MKKYNEQFIAACRFSTVIDSEGYRPNVGIILCNEEGRLFWGKRIGQRSWQFPQGGIQRDESPEQAMFRELSEEVGLQPEHVQVIGCTKGWLRYRLPKRLVRRGGKPACVGQKQIWFLLRMLGNEEAVRLDLSERPEFDHWQWVDYWYPLRAVVPFKRHVYWRALRELAPLLRVGRPPRRTTHDFNSAEARPSAHSTSSVRASSARSSKVACESATVVQRTVVVLPLRRMEIGQHPVITRMVVSARRIGELETTPVAPVLESSAKASLDEARSPRPTASRSHRVSRR